MHVELSRCEKMVPFACHKYKLCVHVKVVASTNCHMMQKTITWTTKMLQSKRHATDNPKQTSTKIGHNICSLAVHLQFCIYIYKVHKY